MVTDVSTREAVTRALPNKNAETVARAAAEAIPGWDEGNYVVPRTKAGNSRRRFQGRAVHRAKRPEDRKRPVVDRTIQTLKKNGWRGAREGGKSDDHITSTIEAYNARPHEAVHAARKTWRPSWRRTLACSSTMQRNSSTIRN